jgi:chromosome segregation ATPase
MLVAMACLFAGLLFLRDQEHAAHEQQLAKLAAENQALKGVSEQRQLERQEAEATQEQLLGRIAQLSAQIDRLQTDLAFYRQQKSTRK